MLEPVEERGDALVEIGGRLAGEAADRIDDQLDLVRQVAASTACSTASISASTEAMGVSSASGNSTRCTVISPEIGE